MAECVWCESKGIILGVDNNSLCRVCQEKVYPDIKARAQSVLRCYEDCEESEVLSVKLSLLETLLADIEILQKYEAKHILTPDINIDLNGILSNTTNASLVEVNVDAHEKEREDLKAAMGEYSLKYGKLPNEFYSIRSEDAEVYLKQVMAGYEQKGISTVAEMEQAIVKRVPFLGPYARGINDGGSYKIFVADTLIYDGSTEYFDPGWKRLQIYSEIQQMVAKHIFHKDLAVIRKERRK